MPAVPLGLKADPGALAELPGVDGKSAQSWLGCPAASGSSGLLPRRKFISVVKTEGGCWLLPLLELATAFPADTINEDATNTTMLVETCFIAVLPFPVRLQLLALWKISLVFSTQRPPHNRNDGDSRKFPPFKELIWLSRPHFRDAINRRLSQALQNVHF